MTLHRFRPDPNNRVYCRDCGHERGHAYHKRTLSAVKRHIRLSRAIQEGRARAPKRDRRGRFSR